MTPEGVITGDLPLISVLATDGDVNVAVVWHKNDEPTDGEPIVVDFEPKPTWPSPSEQADAVAAAVREAWLRQWEYYSGEKVDR